jgi:hypothetical protein
MCQRLFNHISIRIIVEYANAHLKLNFFKRMLSFLLNVDPDPDPASHQRDGNLQLLIYSF